MADNQDSTGTDDEKQIEADARLNAIVKSHLRRELKAFTQQLDAIKAAIAEKPKTETPAEEGKGRGPDGKFTSDKADPQVKALMDAQARIERELKEERDRRVALETKAKKDSIRGIIRAQLEEAGVKGKRLDAAVIMLEQQNLVEQEGGEPIFKVARSRAKGGPVEEMEFDKLHEGVQDWLKSPDAADFLPAPTIPNQGNRAAVRSGQQSGRQPVYDKPARSFDEAIRRTAEQLAAKGVDITEALKGD